MPVSIPSHDTPHGAPKSRLRNRPHALAETIKGWIIIQGLQPGDRLPQEAQLIEELSASKGTMREALKVLETQGLIRTRTGPGGGAFITEVPPAYAASLLANHFFFKDISISNIYELRIALEPQLARDLAGALSPEQLSLLRERTTPYQQPAQTIAEEHTQRSAELEFHETLADFSPNPLLSFQCRFLIRMLRELAICRRIYDIPNDQLRQQGLHYQEHLINALASGDGEEARHIMAAHMRTAQRIMIEQEARIVRKFLL